GSAIINNAGLMIIDGTQFPVFISGVFNNTGTIEKSGTVYFEHGILNFGKIENLNSGAGAVIGAAALNTAEPNGLAAIGAAGGTASITNFGSIQGNSGIVVDPNDVDNITLDNTGIIDGTGGTAVQ